MYLIAGAAAFELSLGFSGYSFRFLYDHVPMFQGLRALARAGIFVVFFLAALAAFGYVAIASSMRRIPQFAFFVLVVALLTAEYRVHRLVLFPYPNEAPPIYAWLARQPPGVVAELPMPVPEVLPGPDARYADHSIFHWHPLLNGYSGFFPVCTSNAQMPCARFRTTSRFSGSGVMAHGTCSSTSAPIHRRHGNRLSGR